MQRKVRDLALFNLAIDSKLRGCDLVSLKVEDIAPTPSSAPPFGKRKQGGNCRSSQTHGTAGSRTGKDGSFDEEDDIFAETAAEAETRRERFAMIKELLSQPQLGTA